MRLETISLALLLTLTTALSLPPSNNLPPTALLPRQDPAKLPAVGPTAGPIPVTPPVRGWPAPQSVITNSRASGLVPSKEEMNDCLVKYSENQFYDGYDGNECAGMGWFKGGYNIGYVDLVAFSTLSSPKYSD